MGQEFNAAALQMKVAAENVANNLVQNNEKVQESGEAEAVAAVSAKAYEQAYKAEQEAALEDIKSRGIFNTGTQEAKDLMAEYAKISGLDQDSNYEVTNYVGDGSVMVKKTLDDGSVEEVKLTAEEIAATVAAERANT
jgi:competence protein ComGC